MRPACAGVSTRSSAAQAAILQLCYISPMIIQVAINSPLHQVFDYLAPNNHAPEQLQPGTRVSVPFGRRDRVGLIIGQQATSQFKHDQLKTIHHCIDEEPLLPIKLLQLLTFAAKYYQHPLGEVLFHALPNRLRLGKAADIKTSLEHFTSKEITTAPTLTNEQTIALQQISQHQQFQPFVLAGITGSGKTEVYLRAIENVIQQQQQALLLVPEIGLTPQTISRFQQRLAIPMAVLHSGLTDRERQDAWLLAKKGDLKLIIGTRSAIFTPLKNPGIIIVDEEHDVSYKQQTGFRYSARDLAIMRAQLANIPIILGSATPSLESIVNVNRKKFIKLNLTQRVGNAEKPLIELIDLRSTPARDGLSEPLIQKIKQHLQANNQVLIFLNRRGFAPSLLCNQCGWSAACKRCSVQMTVHQRPKKLICHHCDKQLAIPSKCPDCASEALMQLGAGTERIETALQTHFPDTDIIRVDRDSTRRKGSFDAMLEKITHGHAQILIGTQMLAKGHHFPNVTLSVIVDADSGLYSTDFRASERMAQLILQVAGRAGRENKPGQVLLQTHNPEHPLLTKLITEQYDLFIEELIAERQMASLPPFSYLSLIRAESTRQELAMSFLQTAKSAGVATPDIHLLGPVPAPIEKINGKYRAQLLIAANQRQALHQWLPQFINSTNALPLARKVRWSVDVDPLDLY